MKVIRYQETVLGCLGIAWALWMAVTDTYNISLVFEIFRVWSIPKFILVVIPLVLGIGIFSPSFRWRKHIHLNFCIFWLLITTAIGINDITSTAVLVYATVGFLHAGMYLLVENVGYR